jgi:hypothetical protein
VLVEHEAQPVGGDRPRDVVAGGEVVGAGRAEDAVGEEPRDVDVVGGDGGEVVEQRGAEVEVGAVRLACELTQVRAVLDVDRLARCAVALGATFAPRLGGRAGAQLVDGAFDRLLGELAVDGLVGDDRGVACARELDQDGVALATRRNASLDVCRRRGLRVQVAMIVMMVAVRLRP